MFGGLMSTSPRFSDLFRLERRRTTTAAGHNTLKLNRLPRETDRAAAATLSPG